MTTISTMSTLQKSLGLRQTITRLDRDQQQAANELSTGLKSDVYASGSFRAAQSLDLRARMTRIDAFATSNRLLAGKMEVMSAQIGTIRSDVQSFIATAVSLTSGDVDARINTEAKSTIQSIFNSLNTAYAGEFLFSGQDASLAAVRPGLDVSAVSGLGANPDAAAVSAAIAATNTWFGLAGGAAQASDWSTTGYGGSHDGPLSVRLDEHTSLDYGLTGNDEAIRHVLKGLAMFAEADMGTISDPAVREQWRAEALAALEKGVTGLQEHEALLGSQQALVERISSEQSSLHTLYNNRVSDIEGVDAYEAATRLEALSTQLEASYQVTVKLQRLSLLNFM